MCHGPVRDDTGIWFCPMSFEDNPDCEKCRDEEEAAAEMRNEADWWGEGLDDPI